MSKELKRYSWKPGRHYGVKAQDFGEWVDKLPDKRPETILREARADKKCPGHKLFEWDNTRAGHEYRLLQARLLYVSLTVEVVIYERKKQRTIQAQAIMRSSKDGDYDNVDIALGDPHKREFVLAQALAELSATKRRYAHLSELAIIFAAIDNVQQRVRKRA